MKLNEACNAIEKAEKSYDYRRSMDAYNIMGFAHPRYVYELCAPNIASILGDPAFQAMAYISILGTIGVYEGIKKKHWATKRIKELKALENDLIRYNRLNQTTEEEFYHGLSNEEEKIDKIFKK